MARIERFGVSLESGHGILKAVLDDKPGRGFGRVPEA